jgi:two-component system sensor histidine kinase UhpB
MRFLVFELRPSILQEDGLVEALTARLSAVEKRVGVSAELDAEGMGRLPSAVEEAFYGIAREALNNSLRHAHATRLTIRLRRRAETAVMEIGDNGVGFEVDPGWGRGGMGLRGMRERAERVAASFDVCSRPGEGTTIRVAARLDGARLQKPAGGKGPQAI